MSDLRERVARACAYAVEMHHSTLDVVNALGFPTIEAFVDKTWPNYLPHADAAIALVLDTVASPAFLRPLVEEQAKGEWDDKTIDEDVAMYSAAIRAMREKSDE